MSNTRKILTLLAVMVSFCLLLVPVNSAFATASSCDGTHIHSEFYGGWWIPCSGSAWRADADGKKIYMRGDWTYSHASNAYNNVQKSRLNGRCVEWEVHYKNVPTGSQITWYAPIADADLDYDTGERHIDIHMLDWGYGAMDMGNITTWVRSDLYLVVGTNICVQDHQDAWGKLCNNQIPCIVGGIYLADGTFKDYPYEWNHAWSNGDRH